MHRGTFACLSLVLGIATSAPGGTIFRRGGLAPIQAPFIAIDDAGVTVRTRSGGTLIIPWDLVRDLEPDSPDPTLDRKLSQAEEMWRARLRLQRNDPALAEPLFERLFERYRGQSSESALIVAEGLLRCRLARGANASAVVPYLETLRLHRDDVTTNRFDMLPSVYDGRTGLCPLLPPFWADPAGRNRLRRDLALFDAGDDEVVGTLAQLLQLAIRDAEGQADVQEELDALVLPDHDGVRLLRNLLQSGAGAPADRVGARERLLNQIPDSPAWSEAWMRYAVGRSYLSESDSENRSKGLVNLVHVSARFAGTQPYLAGLALARLADELAAAGQLREATGLRAELQRRYPGHPILFANESSASASGQGKENE